MSVTKRKIHAALNSLMAACDLKGKSGTETLFNVLSQAIPGVHEQWGIVEESHKNGFGCDVNSLLADEIKAALVNCMIEEGPEKWGDDALFEMIWQPRSWH